MSGYWNPENFRNPGVDQGPQSNFMYNNEDFTKNNLSFHETDYQSGASEFSSFNYQIPPENAQQYDYGMSDQRVEGDGIDDFADEPPLLEELGIDVEQIVRKVVSVLDPFTSTVTIGEYDLAGPLAFCIALAAFLMLSGGKANFGYVYGLAVTSCLMMYVLLRLMTTTPEITLVSVASVLGYALLPVVMLSGLGMLMTLKTFVGYIMAAIAVIWSSIAASRIFVIMSADRDQRPLIAYPCALLYSVFVLIVIF
ncbi:hypothetical protein LSTR_LSTR016948 [Laodelphax striatellus]|uniref:Protein YIPF n=1 Tax=Laodelphax striatellus TaxID=195883 RepID=A0A482WVD5_LAOST|nr:hypothetical protein LSTR_LSTR013996 [Laodelphax striatellus]RZF48629.1 hypothetical protein LSTR_LSTR016948 [Laodelphax striatellus]